MEGSNHISRESNNEDRMDQVEKTAQRALDEAYQTREAVQKLEKTLEQILTQKHVTNGHDPDMNGNATHHSRVSLLHVIIAIAAFAAGLTVKPSFLVKEVQQSESWPHTDEWKKAVLPNDHAKLENKDTVHPSNPEILQDAVYSSDSEELEETKYPTDPEEVEEEEEEEEEEYTTTDAENLEETEYPSDSEYVEYSEEPSYCSDEVTTPPLQAGEISPLYWKNPDENEPLSEQVSEYALGMGLPPKLTTVLLDYCDKNGITSFFRRVTGAYALEAGEESYVELNGLTWYIQRPERKWNSNMHWLSPANEDTQRSYLAALQAGGFDDVLDVIGKYFELDGLVAYQLTFIAVSYCTKGYVHHDFTNADGRAFNVIIPLLLVEDSGPELEVESDDDEPYLGCYKYEYNVATMLGDDARHATAECDYRDKNRMRMAATVYIADVNADNVEAILNDYTQAYPPQDEQLLLSRAGIHWNKNGTGKLPKLA